MPINSECYFSGMAVLDGHTVTITGKSLSPSVIVGFCGCSNFEHSNTFIRLMTDLQQAGVVPSDLNFERQVPS